MKESREISVSIVFFLPFRNILRGVTLLGKFIVDEAELAALLAGRDAVEADEELGAVVGVGVLGMRIVLAKLVSRGRLGALESV